MYEYAPYDEEYYVDDYVDVDVDYDPYYGDVAAGYAYDPYYDGVGYVGYAGF